MNKTRKALLFIFLGLAVLALAACGSILNPQRWNMGRSSPGITEESSPGSPNPSNGERIYFTASSGRGTAIRYRGGPNFGGMMMGSYLTCAACHGPEGRGGVHWMHMQVMDAPDITFTALAAEEHEEENEHAEPEDHGGYDLEDFRLAVIEGKHPDGEPLNPDMPRWQMSTADLEDLFIFLKSW